MQISLLSWVFWGLAFFWQVGHQRGSVQCRQERRNTFYISGFSALLPKKTKSSLEKKAHFKACSFNNRVLCWYFQGRLCWRTGSNEIYFSSRSNCSLFQREQNKCAAKKPARLSWHGAGWQPQARELKTSLNCQLVLKLRGAWRFSCGLWWWWWWWWYLIGSSCGLSILPALIPNNKSFCRSDLMSSWWGSC